MSDCICQVMTENRIVHWLHYPEGYNGDQLASKRSNGSTRYLMLQLVEEFVVTESKQIHSHTSIYSKLILFNDSQHELHFLQLQVQFTEQRLTVDS